MDLKPTERFSSRVQNYVLYRPTYPSAVLGLLALECDLRPGCTVADIGSGTGIFTRPLLLAKAKVYAVEPNEPMRREAEESLGDIAGFRSVGGTAEATTLAADSVDLITCAQAFHWFDRDATRREFERILHAGGHVALVWNERLTDKTQFLRDYDAVLKEYAPEYPTVTQRNVTEESLAEFFAPLPMSVRSFGNAQLFDLQGFVGRVLSSSYAPEDGHPAHGPMIESLVQVFERHSVGGQIEFLYETRVYWGRLHLPV